MADAHWNLGIALQEQGRFAEALIELQRGHDLGSVQPKNTAPSAHWIRETQRLIDLEPQFPMLLNGQARPKNAADALTMAKLCQLHCRRYYAAAARFFGEAFAADPKLAQDLRSGYRYSAACAAALAGCGQGTNAATLDVKACIRLREQALAWLRADLTAWQAQLQMDPGKARGVVIQTMRHWQHDGDFDGVRSAKALAKLPENERREWQKLWHEVEALARAEAPGKKAVPDSTSKGSKELP
jgi:serine/threonine-protein kinase